MNQNPIQLDWRYTFQQSSPEKYFQNLQLYIEFNIERIKGTKFRWLKYSIQN
jgi:hypothetical protein